MHVWSIDLADSEFYDAVLELRSRGIAVRVIRGHKSKDFDGMMNEFSAALQFPYYFGANWSAMQECLSDLDSPEFRRGIVLAISHAHQVLCDEARVEIATLVRTLSQAAAEYRLPIADGEWWDRPPIPFMALLQDHGRSNLDRWRAGGAEICSLDRRELLSRWPISSARDA